MHILDSVQNQTFRCHRCGNSDFSGIDTTLPFICPVTGCRALIDPDRPAPVLPDPGVPTVRTSQPRSAAADPLIYERDENGEWAVVGVSGDPAELTIPAMAGGRVITAIGPHAFAGLRQLRRVTLPDTIAVIGEEAFANCAELDEIHFGAGLTALEKGCLRCCSALKEIALPEKLQAIGPEAFALCTRLERIALGDSIRSIGAEAFLSCISLTQVSCRRAPESIAPTAFANCCLDADAEAALFPAP